MKKSYFLTITMLMAFYFVCSTSLFANNPLSKDESLFKTTTTKYSFWNSLKPNVNETVPPCLNANNYSFSTEENVKLEGMNNGSTEIFGSSQDENSVQVELPFSFNFLGVSSTSFMAYVNGILIPSGSDDGENHPTNITENVSNAMFPFWDDLATGSNGSIKTKVIGESPNRKFVVEWNVTTSPNYELPYAMTFQVWMFEASNVLQYVYGPNSSNSNAYTVSDSENQDNLFSATIGIKGQSGIFNEIATTTTNSTTTVNDNFNIWPGNGKSYIFSPGNAENLIPEFTQVEPICLGDELLDLETTSINGIDGTWSPELNNKETTEYTFTPTDAFCAKSTTMTITVKTIPPPLGSEKQSFCLIDNPKLVDLSVQGKGDIVWYATAESTTPLLATQSLISKDYFATQSNGSCESVSRLKVAVTVKNPLAPQGKSVQVFCKINKPMVSNIAAIGTAIVWYKTITGTTPLSGTDLLESGNYYATQTVANCESNSRLSVMVTVQDPSVPKGNAEQFFCKINKPTVANLSANGVGIVWFDSLESTIPLSKTSPLISGRYFAAQNIEFCESKDRLVVDVTVQDPSAPSGDEKQEFCTINKPKVMDLVADGSGISWYDTATSTTPLSGNLLVTTKNYYASQTIENCESSTRLVVAVTVFNPSAPVGDKIQVFCAIDEPTVSNLKANGTAIVWYESLTGTTPLADATLLVTKYYYASQRELNCESNTRLIVYVTVSNPNVPSGNKVQSFCTINNPKVSNISATGTGILWYDTLTGTSPLSISESLKSGNYYATQTVSGCTSKDRLMIAVTVADPVAPKGISQQSFCWNNLPTVANLAVSGTGILLYITETGSKPLLGSTLLTTGTYYAAQNIGICSSSSRLSVEVVVSKPEAPSFPTSLNFCAINKPDVSALIGTGTNLKCYISSKGGKALVPKTVLSSRNYYISQTVSGCESERTLVAVSLTSSFAGTVSANQLIFIGSQPKDITITKQVGTIQWQTASDSKNFSDIVGADKSNLTADQMKISTSNKYFRALVTNNECSTVVSIVVAVFVTTPTKVQSLQCGQTLASISTSILADAVLGATNYRFKVVLNKETRIIETIAKKYFYLTSLVGSALYSTNYEISVATKNSGIWSDYGNVCIVRTPDDANKISAKLTNLTVSKGISPLSIDSEMIDSEMIVSDTIFVKAYTNPFLHYFKFNFSSLSQSDVDVTVYDMIGNRLENLHLSISEINNFEIGHNYPTGVYNVIVTQDQEIKTLRVIKR